MHQSPLLVAEDEDHDFFLLSKAFPVAGVGTPLVRAVDGAEAIAYLGGEGAFRDRDRYPFPKLLLLDIKMPRVSGFEVLSWVRGQETIRDALPIVIWSSSILEPDIKKALELGAHEYLPKPSDFSGFVGLARVLNDAWLKPHGAGQQRRVRYRVEGRRS